MCRDFLSLLIWTVGLDFLHHEGQCGGLSVCVTSPYSLAYIIQHKCQGADLISLDFHLMSFLRSLASPIRGLKLLIEQSLNINDSAKIGVSNAITARGELRGE